MNSEEPRLLMNGHTASPVAKLVALVLGMIMVISAVVLGFLVLGVLLALLLVGWIGFSLRRWLQPTARDDGGRRQMRPGEPLEGEYTVIQKHALPESGRHEQE